jgi:hypothetical protein
MGVIIEVEAMKRKGTPRMKMGISYLVNILNIYTSPSFLSLHI